ncbi:MAG TPA: hypothetical protein PKG48_09325 [Bacteroidales bacterium]|nr:hypothetical protein [Bacteroidales bacterium]HPS61896.1 hypothetical protein [Bacteroidales bacterium]
MKNILFLLIPAALLLGQCKPAGNGQEKSVASVIPQATIDSVIAYLSPRAGECEKPRMEKGVKQCAAMWTRADGTSTDFANLCKTYFAADDAGREALFNRLSANWESLFGHFNMISLDLKRGMHLDIGEMLPVDEIFGAYDPYAHFNDDMFTSKMAFITALNFPFYTLKEKEELGPKWSRLQWAYVRMGDLFNSRVPAEVNVKISEALTEADNYISRYNIYVGNLVDEQGKTHFDKDMKLLSHWNLRDELKANYNKGDEGLLKQKMIYQVMLRIIQQDIPDSVINNPAFQWNPFTNKMFRDGKEVKATPEPDTRYATLLKLFRQMKAMDPYTPANPNFIQRSFDGGMELPQEQVEKLFTDLCSSPQVRQVGELISKRLGRPLQPFDIWYDGFKPRSNMNAELLDKTTRAKYPNTQALEADIPNILQKMGFTPDKAREIASHITVDPARGSGHAWGAQMKGDKAHLRTRIGKAGMDYKGYNIAIHELGHNVEQTISLYFVDHYMMQGVPNTAFTEAFAFTFQKHDLELLGMKDNTPNKEELAALDNFWGSYEIMGVSLLDMKVWKWLYEHPDATKEQLKETVVKAAIEVWNQYYAPVFGVKDTPILAIYSHMIDNPLYLPNYPVGHLIDFQLDRYFKGKNFADEAIRIYSTGRMIPQLWMKNAVGSEISIQPLLSAVNEALKVVTQ